MTNARQLTPQEALSRALGTEAAHLTASRSSALTLSYTSKDPATGNAGVYVFNCSGDNGYAVISADDVAEALLGYADEGRFDPDNIPANMKAWLETYTAEIAWASTQSSSEGISTYTSGRPTRSSIAPLCKTQWNQSAPYNNECPLDPRNNQRCVTGCVATAMAQVMKYHNWPEKAPDPTPIQLPVSVLSSHSTSHQLLSTGPICLTFTQTPPLQPRRKPSQP